jgi:hypothetical protein
MDSKAFLLRFLAFMAVLLLVVEQAETKLWFLGSDW